MSNGVLSEFRLDGKVCLVTGASRGIGRAIAIALAEAGADVAVVARTYQAIEETAQVIKECKRKTLAISCDVHDSKSVNKMVVDVLDEFGQIDVVINNAGGGDMKPILEMSEDEWLGIVDLNLNSMFRVCKAVGPHMVERKQGKIINMSSMYGLIGERNVTAYCASKGAIIQLTRALALEWAEYNITVNALAPGYIYTERTSRVFDTELGDVFTSRVPLRRVGKAEELGPLVVFLASSASDFMTGSVITIDGGQTAA